MHEQAADPAERLKKKDPSALEEIIRKYNSYAAVIVYTILQGHLPDLDIQGVINQVFSRLWEHADSLHMESDEEIKPYIGAIARNTAINEKKKIISSVPLEDEILGEFHFPDSGEICAGLMGQSWLMKRTGIW